MEYTPTPDPGRFLEAIKPHTLLQVQMRDGHVFEQKYARHNASLVFFAGEPDSVAFDDVEHIFARRNRVGGGLLMGGVAGALIAVLAVETYPEAEIFLVAPAGAAVGCFIGGTAGKLLRHWELVYAAPGDD